MPSILCYRSFFASNLLYLNPFDNLGDFDSMGAGSIDSFLVTVSAVVLLRRALLPRTPPAGLTGLCSLGGRCALWFVDALVGLR